jgi:ankyrin repeat protein
MSEVIMTAKRLLEVCWQGEVARLAELIRGGVDVNTAESDGRTPIMAAASEGHADAVRLLIEAGADVRARDQSGDTALSEAAYEGHAKVVKLLLDAGADVNTVGKELNHTPLMSAAWEGHAEVVRLLIAAGADVNAADPGGNTALMKAADGSMMADEPDFPNTVRALLEGGADVNTKNRQGGTALMFAARFGAVEVARLLLEAGANPNVQSEDGATALSTAVTSGRFRLVPALIEAGADVNQGAPLLQAVVLGRHRLVVRLLKGGADPNVACREYAEFHDALAKGNTPLMVAAQQGKDRIVAALLEAGADVSVRNDRGQTALAQAARHGFASIVDRLREAGAEEEIEDESFQNLALLRAAARGDGDRLGRLLKAGADPNARDQRPQDPCEQDRIPLIYAAEKGHLAVVEQLLQAGADPNAATPSRPMLGQNETPLLVAAQSGHPRIVQTLIDAGARVNETNDAGMTALVAAAEAGEAEAAKVLLQAGADAGIRSQANGPTAFEAAMQNDHGHVADILLQFGADPGPGALAAAAGVGDVERVRHLIAAGVPVDQCEPCEDGQTALIRAIEIHAKVVERDPKVDLLESDDKQQNQARWFAEVAEKQRTTVLTVLEAGAAVEARDARGRTPLIAAAEMECSITVSSATQPGVELHKFQEMDPTPVVRLLLDRGADPNARDLEGSTALIRASGVDRRMNFDPRPVVRLLLDAGADVKAQDNEGRSALHSAIEGYNTAVVQMLIECGADVNARDKRLVTPLAHAVEEDAPRMARLLIDAGADLNARDCEGATVLDRARQCGQKSIVRRLREAGAQGEDQRTIKLRKAARKGNLEKVRDLLDSGAEIHRLSRGTDAFGEALCGGHVEVVREMLRRGADVNRCYPHPPDTRPLMKAVQGKSVDLVRVLLDSGADVDAADGRGWSPLVMTAFCRNREMVELLRARGAAVDERAADFLEQFQFAEAAESADFQAAVRELAGICGSNAQTIDWLPGVYAWRVTAGQETERRLRSQDSESRWLAEQNALREKVAAILDKTQSVFLERGYHVVDMGSPPGCGPAGNFIGLLPTANKFAVIAAVGVNPGGDYGPYGLHSPDVVAWLSEMDSDNPFQLTGCRHDTVDVKFLRPVKDPEGLARRMYEFCSDMVDQGIGSIERLVEELRDRRRAHFWWD